MRASSPGRTAFTDHFWLADLIFILFAFSYACLAVVGVTDMSAGGAILDSDLQTYAQGMAGERHPELFGNDAVLDSISAANSIPNLQRMLADWLSPEDGFGIGLLRAGGMAIFIFYCAWYGLGRWLWRSPALSAILALCAGITVWVGWGTFWGVTHSDPVPRVFFAAFFPVLLLAALMAFNRPFLRPLVMFLVGMTMWVHGVSALNTGAMIFMAFLFIRARDASFRSHLANALGCLVAFFIPVLLFLWPSLSQKSAFTPEQLAIFQEMFSFRWQNDYSNFGPRLLQFFSPHKPTFWLVACALPCWLALYLKGQCREKQFCKIMPCFCLALAIVTAFCWAESHYAARFGRLSMGHELVRGLRFLIPCSWILVVGALGLVFSKWPRRVLLLALVCGLLALNQDRQFMGAKHALGMAGLPEPDSLKQAVAEADNYRAVLEAVKNAVPPGEAIFSDEEIMGVRHISLRPVVYTFKDGYVFYYNKDFAKSANWLRFAKMLNDGEQGLVKAWELSGAPWLLVRPPKNSASLENYASLVWEKDGWLLFHKK